MLQDLSRRLVRLSPLVLVVFLAGCIDAGLPLYGAKIKKMYPDQITIDTRIPPNAPSIFQQYRVFADDSYVREGKTEHLGIDFLGPKGAPVLAPAPGRVIQAGTGPMYGNTLTIDHGKDAQGRRIVTVYKHMDRRIAKKGDVVARGQQIGALGRTGFLSSGLLHLHFEVQRADRRGRLAPVDPGEYWMGGRGRATCFQPNRRYPDRPFRITYPVACKSGSG